MRKRLTPLLCFVTALVLSLSPTPLRADDTPAKPDAPAKSGALTQYAVVSDKSLDALAAVSKTLGIPVVPPMTSDGIEHQYPFLGKGSIATDQPIGAAMFGGPDIKSPEQGMVFVIPVKPNTVTLDMLKAAGGKAIPDHDDCVAIEGGTCRRTQDYVLICPTTAAVTLVDPAKIVAAVKDGDILVSASLDLKAVRTGMPDQYKQVKDMAMGNVPKEAADAVTKNFAQLDALDMVSMDLSNGEKGLRLGFMATPYKMPALTAANKPGMPAGVVGRIDLGVAVQDLTPNFKDAEDALVRAAQSNGREAEKQQIEDIVTRFVNVLTDASATSIGVEVIAGEPVVYIVQHRAKPGDTSKEVIDVATRLNANMKADGDKNYLSLQTYPLGDVKVLRIVPMDNGTTPLGAMDLVQKGDDVYVAIAPNAYRYVDKLMAAQNEGPYAAVFSVSIDLGHLATQLTDGDKAPLASMLQPDQRKQLVDTLKGQKFDVASMSVGEGSRLELGVTKGVVENMQKLLGVFGMGGAPGNAAPAPAGDAAPPPAK